MHFGTEDENTSFKGIISTLKFRMPRRNLMEDLAEVAIKAGLDAGASFVDVRIENTTTTILEMTDGVTRRSMASRLKGAGIRAFIDGAWAFAQSTDLTHNGMKEIGASVAKLALATREKVADKFDIEGPTFKKSVKYPVQKPFHDVSIDDKITLVKMIDKQAHDFDERIVNTRTIYGDLWTELYVANSLGTNVYLENSLPRLVSVATAKEGNNRQRGYLSVGTRGGFGHGLQQSGQLVGV